MKVTRFILTLFIGLFFLASLSAQNLNPTVEVTNLFKGKTSQVHKPSLKMAIPDSLLRFDLNFDYSIFARPYKGAYSFSPYIIDMRLSKRMQTIKTFYLRAGLGWDLCPTMDLVWTPNPQAKFNYNIYANLDGLMKLYGNTANLKEANMNLTVSPQHRITAKLHNSLGINGYYDADTYRFNYDLSYRNISSYYDKYLTYNRLALNLDLHSNQGYEGNYYYNISGDLNMGYVSTYVNGKFNSPLNIDYNVNIAYGPRKSYYSYFIVAVNVNGFRYGARNSYMGSILPEYKLSTSWFNFSAGVNLSYAYTPEWKLMSKNYGLKPFLFPKLDLSLSLIKSYLDIYASLNGGHKLYSYTDILKRNPFFFLSAHSPRPFTNDFYFQSEVERLNAKVGIQGNIMSAFKYNVNLTYKAFNTAMLENLVYNGDRLDLSYSYAPYQAVCSNLMFGLNLGSVGISAYGRYSLSKFVKSKTVNVGLLPARLNVGTEISYNYIQRLKVSANLEYRSSKKGRMLDKDNVLTSCSIPSYWNLGVGAEYLVNWKFSIWARVDNLLNRQIQIIPLHPENRLSLSAGVCVNL